ncbi:MAG: aspartate--tRNA ligase [Armatimonas sp.]
MAESWQRSVECGMLRDGQVGETVTVNGWAQSVRDHGGVVFIDLRDRTGLVQIVVDPGRDVTPADVHKLAESIKDEFCLSITGRVARRPEGLENPKLATGAVEVEASALNVLNPSKVLPFLIEDEVTVNEETRLKYRYLDLRRPTMLRKMRLRHELVRAVREYFWREGFYEIETPILTKSSPEGARDYLVPFRLSPGLFYALPQAPQQFKQLLMVGGLEKYFQIAKCFRDESQRADRQPEFTQIDLEMAFATQDDVLGVVERMIIEVVEKFTEETGKTIFQKPFPRFSYDEAIARYGTDKPDIRFGLELVDCAAIFENTGFAVFQNALKTGGQIKAIRYPGGASIPRSQMDELVKISREYGAGGLAYVLVEATPEEMRGTIAKFLTTEERAALIAATEAQPGDLVGFVADKPEVVAKALDGLRRFLGKKLNLIDKNQLAYCWIVDFPVFEKDEETGGLTFAHNPFAMPQPADLDKFDTDPLGMRAQCYDLVCNGIEFASGAVRIHIPEIQVKVFEKMGLTPEQIRERFGHMLDAFSFGAPPHAGMAPGLDRLVMVLTDEENIREVMAFPKLGGGRDPMMEAPSTVEPKQIEELGLAIVEKPKE